MLLIGPNVPADYAPLSTTLILGVDRDAINEQTVPAIVSWQSTFASDAPLLIEVVGPFDDERPARRRLDDVSAHLAAHHVHASTSIVVADDPISGLIDAAAGRQGPLFVAISARYTDGRLHWHSSTQRLVAHAACPVLVVPARPAPLPLRPILEEHLAFHDRTAPVHDFVFRRLGVHPVDRRARSVELPSSITRDSPFRFDAVAPRVDTHTRERSVDRRRSAMMLAGSDRCTRRRPVTCMPSSLLLR